VIDLHTQLYLGSLFLLFILNLITMAAQVGLLNARRSRLLALGAQRETQINRTLELIDRPHRLRASLQLTQALLRFLFAGLMLVMLAPWEAATQPLLPLSGVLLLIALSLWLSEFLTKKYVLRNPESWALQLTAFAHVPFTLLRPILGGPLAISQEQEHEASSERADLVTEDELKTLVDASRQEGILEQAERKMIRSIFELGDG